MPLGHQAYIVECQTNSTYGTSVFPCADIAGNYYQPVLVNAYIIEAENMTKFEGLDIGFDYALAGQYMAYAFTGVFVMWSFGLICGKIIQPMWGK